MNSLKVSPLLPVIWMKEIDCWDIFSFQIVQSTGLRVGLNQAIRSLAQKSNEQNTGSSDQKPKQQQTGKDGKQLWHYASEGYHGYNMYSYFDIETDMVKYRLQQPTSLPETVNIQGKSKWTLKNWKNWIAMIQRIFEMTFIYQCLNTENKFETQPSFFLIAFQSV